MESELHRKIVLRQDVIIQDRQRPALDGLQEMGQLVFLKTESDVITITPIMREILEVASAPCTPHELIQWVAKTWGCSYESVYQPVWSFLKRMGRLGVLVYEEIQENTSASLLEELERDMRFAGYTLLKRLSKNHKVALYKCSMGESDSPLYTLKILLMREPDESTRRKFFKEYELLETLAEHRNIRNCLFASTHHKIPFLLFEYIDGVSMSKKVDIASIETKCRIASQLLDAINHLHRHQILHGDIHASNFLIDNENNLHLIDLGMAHFEHEDEMHHGGVPRYMPPERMPDHPFYFSQTKGDYKSEVFQTGVCLYFLFSGNYPFRALLLKNLANAIKYDPPLPLIKTPLGELIPQSVISIISKSMEKDPAKRYASIAEMTHAWAIATSKNEMVLS